MLNQRSFTVAIVSNHGLIRFIRFVSRLTIYFYNTIYFLTIFSTSYKRFIKILRFTFTASKHGLCLVKKTWGAGPAVSFCRVDGPILVLPFKHLPLMGWAGLSGGCKIAKPAKLLGRSYPRDICLFNPVCTEGSKVSGLCPHWASESPPRIVSPGLILTYPVYCLDILQHLR